MAKWLETDSFLVVSIGDQRPIILQKGSDKYVTAMALCVSNASDEEFIQALDVGAGIEKFSEGTFTVDGERILIDSEEVRDILAERILAFYKGGHPYLPLVNFYRNIQQNPSDESKEHLYLFLEVNKMPITPDGCFLAYKKVARDDHGNLVDAYTKKFCNNVGAVVCMERAKVDPNRKVTCSTGLHVAAFNYAQNNYSGAALLEVKVNPKDVVAVPNDYNNEKMRVCRYEVMAINPGQPVVAEYLEQMMIRSKRKHGQKTIKGEKREIKAKLVQDHQDLIASLKSTAQGDNIDTSDLAKLTAREIIEVVQALTDIDMLADKITEGQERVYLKNKKSIIKKATQILVGMAKSYY